MIVSLNKNNITNLQNEFLIGTRFGVRTYIVDLSDINIAKTKIYLNVDKIIHESELAELEEFLLSHLDYAGFYYSDMSVFMIAKKHGFVNKLIYNPGTLVTSVSDAEFYLGLGIKRVCLSREITLEDILKFSHLKKQVEIIVHGKLNMFYSKRKLLTNYFDFLEQDPIKEGTLEEETRDVEYPIIEDSTGTHIFHEEVLNSFNEFDKIKQFTLRVDGLLLTDELEEAVNIYNSLEQGNDSKELINEYISKYGEGFSGYYYKKTLYKK